MKVPHPEPRLSAPEFPARPDARSSSRRFILLVAASLGLALQLPGCRPQTAHESSPDAFVEALRQAQENDSLAVLWHALPPSYQRDLQAVLTELGTSLDRKTWDEIRATAGAFAQLIAERGQDLHTWIARLSPDAQAIDLQRLWGWLDSLAVAAPADPARLGEVSLAELVEGHGPGALSFFDSLETLGVAPGGSSAGGSYRGARTEVLSRDPERATLRVEAPDRAPEEIAYQIVEGHWVPVLLAQSWSEGMRHLGRNLRQLVEGGRSPEFRASLTTLRSRLDDLRTSPAGPMFWTRAQAVVDQVRALVGG